MIGHDFGQENELLVPREAPATFQWGFSVSVPSPRVLSAVPVDGHAMSKPHSA